MEQISKENKTSEAQIKASTKWNQKNKEKVKKNRHKSGCRIYIRDFANAEELEEVEGWIEDRKKVLKKS